MCTHYLIGPWSFCRAAPCFFCLFERQMDNVPCLPVRRNQPPMSPRLFQLLLDPYCATWHQGRTASRHTQPECQHQSFIFRCPVLWLTHNYLKAPSMTLLGIRGVWSGVKWEFALFVLVLRRTSRLLVNAGCMAESDSFHCQLSVCTLVKPQA